MAQIERRNPTKWRARVRRNGQPDKSKSFRTRSEAERWAREVENEMDRGVFVDRSKAERMTMRELFQKYRNEITPSKRGWKSETCRLNALCEDDIAAIKVAKLTTPKLAFWRDERLKAVSGSTVLRDLNLIGHVIETARREWEIALPENPVRLVRKPRSNPARDRRLSAGEQTKLLAALDTSDNRAENGTFLPNTARNPWLATIVELAIETAMRQGELVSLSWSNIDLDRRTAILPQTKNGERRVVPLSSRAAALLSSLPEPHDGDAFPGVTAEAVKRGFARAVKRAGIEDFHFHDLRHEATSRLFEKGLNPLEVASITGHKTLQMLKRYTHFRAEELAKKLG